VQIHEIRLEFDDQKRAARAMKGQDIDGPTLMPNRECDFRCRLPSRISIEPASDDFMHGRVTASEHSVQIPAAPSGLYLDPTSRATAIRIRVPIATGS